MLNEERIKLMTRMASYEENEGKKVISIDHYFRADYIGLQVIKAAISATIAFGLVAAMYLYYHLETFMQNIYKMDLVVVVRNIVIFYVVAILVYMIIAYLVAAYRYGKAKHSLKLYYAELKKLSAMYESEGKTKEF